jgi:hypothetical protein
MSARGWQRPGDCLVCAYGAPDGAPAARRGGYLGSPGRAGEPTLVTRAATPGLNPAGIPGGVDLHSPCAAKSQEIPVELYCMTHGLAVTVVRL